MKSKRGSKIRKEEVVEEEIVKEEEDQPALHGIFR